MTERNVGQVRENQVVDESQMKKVAPGRNNGPTVVEMQTKIVGTQDQSVTENKTNLPQDEVLLLPEPHDSGRQESGDISDANKNNSLTPKTRRLFEIN